MKKTFQWLNVSQFTGAFNDNAFKRSGLQTVQKTVEVS
jgi:hypothetical protein